MINANELRIGNWVKWDNADNYYQLEEIKENSGDDIDPIPLTPEMLNKLGIVNRTIPLPISELIKYDYKSIWLTIENDCVCINFSHDLSDVPSTAVDDCTSLDNIKYLHQLQNLYFSLIGKELTIKEPIISTPDFLSSQQ